MEDPPSRLQDFYHLNVMQLKQLTELICGDLDSVRRKILVALITTDVHARDIVEKMAASNVCSLNDFIW